MATVLVGPIATTQWYKLPAALTSAGQDRVTACHYAVEVIEQRTVSGLSRRERQQILRSLRRCVDALQAS